MCSISELCQHQNKGISGGRKEGIRLPKKKMADFSVCFLPTEMMMQMLQAFNQNWKNENNRQRNEVLMNKWHGKAIWTVDLTDDRMSLWLKAQHKAKQEKGQERDKNKNSEQHAQQAGESTECIPFPWGGLYFTVIFQCSADTFFWVRTVGVSVPFRKSHCKKAFRRRMGHGGVGGRQKKLSSRQRRPVRKLQPVSWVLRALHDGLGETPTP